RSLSREAKNRRRPSPYLLSAAPVNVLRARVLGTGFPAVQLAKPARTGRRRRRNRAMKHRHARKLAMALALSAATWMAAAAEPGPDDTGACLNGTGDDAIATCTRLVDSATLQGRAFADIYVKRGATWFAMGRDDRAMEDYERAIALAPDHS